MENPWVAFKLSSPRGTEGFAISVYEGEGTGNRAHHSARLLGTLSESYDTYEEVNARLNELNRGLEVERAMNEEHITDGDRDLLWLVDKENADRKYYVKEITQRSTDVSLVGEPVKVTATMIANDDGKHYYGSGYTSVEAIVYAIQAALKHESRRVEAKAALDKYGE